VKVSRVIFAAALVLGVIWNILCLVGVLPFGVWHLTFTIVGFGALCVLLPHALRKTDGSTAGRNAAGIAIGEFAAWVVTVIACLVYPL
jgi:uncharacterized RDD family membrane protein YckC